MKVKRDNYSQLSKAVDNHEVLFVSKDKTVSVSIGSEGICNIFRRCYFYILGYTSDKESIKDHIELNYDDYFINSIENAGSANGLQGKILSLRERFVHKLDSLTFEASNRKKTLGNLKNGINHSEYKEELKIIENSLDDLSEATGKFEYLLDLSKKIGQIGLNRFAESEARQREINRNNILNSQKLHKT